MGIINSTLLWPAVVFYERFELLGFEFAKIFMAIIYKLIFFHFVFFRGFRGD